MRPFRVTSPKNLVSSFKALFHSCTHINISHSLLNFLWRARALQGRLRIQCSLRDSSIVARQSVPTDQRQPKLFLLFPSRELISRARWDPLWVQFSEWTWMCASRLNTSVRVAWDPCFMHESGEPNSLCGSDTQIAPSLSWSREQHLSMTSIWARIHTHDWNVTPLIIWTKGIRYQTWTHTQNDTDVFLLMLLGFVIS